MGSLDPSNGMQFNFYQEWKVVFKTSEKLLIFFRTIDFTTSLTAFGLVMPANNSVMSCKVSVFFDHQLP